MEEELLTPSFGVAEHDHRQRLIVCRYRDLPIRAFMITAPKFHPSILLVTSAGGRPRMGKGERGSEVLR
jgi:hypothetical protein